MKHLDLKLVLDDVRARDLVLLDLITVTGRQAVALLARSRRSGNCRGGRIRLSDGGRGGCSDASSLPLQPAPDAMEAAGRFEIIGAA